MRPGGDWLVLDWPTATGGGTIVSFVVAEGAGDEGQARRSSTVRRERTDVTSG